MYSCQYPHLFEPIRLGNTVFRNRIFASPTGYQNMCEDNLLPEGAAAYYGRKAMGGAASVATCELIVDAEFGKGGANQVTIDDSRAYHPLCRVADAITRHGAVAVAELEHTGMFANRALAMFGGKPTGRAFGPVTVDTGDRIVEAMDEAFIQRTIQKYAQAAATAKRAGFGMILIHAGHGWMIHQFLNPNTNTRTDQWGGKSIENRARLLREILKAVRQAVGPGFPIEVRISGSECFEGGYGLDEGIAIAQQIDGLCDLIHVSAGNHEIDEVFSITHPSMFQPDGVNVYLAAEIKKHVRTPVATVGALGDPELMEEIIASGKADVVELARALLADPDLPVKLRTGRKNEIKKCMRCLSCFSTELTVGEPYCAINPETGRELDMMHDYPTANVRKKVLIVGGGVAGMEAAITCSKRGHEVILCEKSPRLGGALRCEEKVPFKKKLDEYLNQQEAIIKASPIELRLNTEVTKEYAQEVGADVILACTGARPVVPRIPGIDGANVLGAEYAYTHPGEVGNTVAVLGGGLVGIELAIYLSMLGRKVSVIEMLPEMNDGGNFLHASALRLEIQKYSIQLLLSTKAERIGPDGVRCSDASGERFVPADTVIYAVGQRSLSEEAIALHDAAPDFYMIGDCKAPKNISAATSAAFMISRDIGRY